MKCNLQTSDVNNFFNVNVMIATVKMKIVYYKTPNKCILKEKRKRKKATSEDVSLKASPYTRHR